MTQLLSDFDPDGTGWGFGGPGGTGLGGTSAPSMPGLAPTDTWYGNPEVANNAMQAGFAREVERRYGPGANPRGGVFDPRGGRAEEPAMPADYRQGENMEMDPYASIKDFEQEANDLLSGGMPSDLYGGRPNPRSVIDPRVLAQDGSGLARDTAEFMADALSQYDPGIVEGFQVPLGVQIPTYSDDVGLLSRGGEIPSTFLDANLRSNPGPDLGDAAARVRMGIPEYQLVDANGTVGKYPEGTGPYDAPGMTRPGGIAGAKYGTAINGQSKARMQARAGVGAIGAETGSGTPSKVPYMLGALGLGALAVWGLTLISGGVKGRR